jgi:hypothetical protein
MNVCSALDTLRASASAIRIQAVNSWDYDVVTAQRLEELPYRLPD